MSALVRAKQSRAIQRPREDRFAVYDADIPSRAMARWLSRAADDLLPNLDLEGHAIPVRVIRACHYRGWVRRRGPKIAPENDNSVRWYITERGREALRRAEIAHGVPAMLELKAAMSIVYGTCKECGATPIDDRTELCEECEREARISGALDDDDLDEDESGEGEHVDWPHQDDPDFYDPPGDGT
jgi:hypothetical protein